MSVAEWASTPTCPCGPAPAPGDGYPRVSIRDLRGKVVASITSADPRAPGGFMATHAVRPDLPRRLVRGRGLGHER